MHPWGSFEPWDEVGEGSSEDTRPWWEVWGAVAAGAAAQVGW